MPVERFVRDSVELLTQECPVHAARLHRLLAGGVDLAVDGESFGLQGLQVGPPSSAPVQVCTTRGALQDLLSGRIGLLDAVLQDRVRLRGDPADLAAFDETLRTWVAGAARSPGHPLLLEAFLS